MLEYLDTYIVSVLIGGFFSFHFCTVVLMPFIFNRYGIYKKYNVPEFYEIDWNARFTSNIHAVIVFAIAFYYICIHPTPEELVEWQTPTARLSIALITAYTFSDLCLIFQYPKRVGGEEYLNYTLHHLSTISIAMLSLGNGYLVYFGNLRILVEASTFFMNTRWCMSITLNNKTPYYLANGVLFTVTFFLTRVATIPFFYTLVWKTSQTQIYMDRVGTAAHYYWVGGCLVMDVLNVFWFHKVFLGLMKLLKNGSKTAQVGGKND